MESKQRNIYVIFTLFVFTLVSIPFLDGAFTYNVPLFSYSKMNTQEKEIIKEIHNLEDEYKAAEKLADAAYLHERELYREYRFWHTGKYEGVSDKQMVRLLKIGEASRESDRLETEKNKIARRIKAAKKELQLLSEIDN